MKKRAAHKILVILKAHLQKKHAAAAKIQAFWKAVDQRRQAEQAEQEALHWEQEQQEADDYGQSYGCDCGDWMCSGCGEGPYIACCVCGNDCRGGDYERWRFCTRRCMVSAARD